MRYSGGVVFRNGCLIGELGKGRVDVWCGDVLQRPGIKSITPSRQWVRLQLEPYTRVPGRHIRVGTTCELNLFHETRRGRRLSKWKGTIVPGRTFIGVRGDEWQ